MALTVYETIMAFFALACLIFITAIEETRETFFILFRSDVEILADSFAPFLIRSHLLDLLLIGKSVGGFGGVTLLFSTLLSAAFFAILKPSGVHVNVRLNQREHSFGNLGQVLGQFPEQRILADGRIYFSLHIRWHTSDSLIEAAVKYETLTVHKSDFLYADTMQVEHEFPLDYIFLCADAFGVLYDSPPSIIVGIYKVGDVSAGALDQHADRFAL